jgi:hypothetical protein
MNIILKKVSELNKGDMVIRHGASLAVDTFNIRAVYEVKRLDDYVSYITFDDSSNGDICYLGNELLVMCL